MKAYILCDYEGTTGTVSWEEESTMGPEAMAGDVNAIIAGLRAAGFTEFVVRDYHSAGRTIVPNDLDPDAILVRGKSTPFPYLLDSGFDAMVFAGAHSMAGTATGVMSHTMTGDVFDTRINGTAIGEVGGYILLAGHFGIPMILVTGDEAACREATDMLVDVETAAVKTGLSRTCASCMSPTTARKLIEERAFAAARRFNDFKPLKWAGPFTLEVTFMSAEHADRGRETLKGERIGDRTVRVTGDAVPDVLQCFERGFK